MNFTPLKDNGKIKLTHDCTILLLTGGPTKQHKHKLAYDFFMLHFVSASFLRLGSVGFRPFIEV